MLGYRFFVEGPRDADFLKKVVLPRLNVATLEELDESVITYSGVEATKNAGFFCASLQQGYKSYILIDLDSSPCVTAAKQHALKKRFNFKGLRRPPDLERKVFVVCPEIEAWYLAGVPSNNSLGIPVYSSTDDLTKERFEQICRQIGENSIDVVLKILDDYDWNLAKTRNRSLNYFAIRLGL